MKCQNMKTQLLSFADERIVKTSLCFVSIIKINNITLHIENCHKGIRLTLKDSKSVIKGLRDWG